MMNLLETLVKAFFGFGTTVEHTTDVWGHRRKIVHHHDTGKKKTYTYGTGLFQNVTKLKVERRGNLVSEGEIRKRFWGGTDEYHEHSDGTSVERRRRPGFFCEHVTTHTQGPCFKCSGSGSRVSGCRTCQGNGWVLLKAQTCFTCHGSGSVGGSLCRRCRGSGQHKAARSVTCRRCGGAGSLSARCNRCDGSGRFSRTTSR